MVDPFLIYSFSFYVALPYKLKSLLLSLLACVFQYYFSASTVNSKMRNCGVISPRQTHAKNKVTARAKDTSGSNNTNGPKVHPSQPIIKD